MRTKILFTFLFFIVFYSNTGAQTCTTCIDSNNSITNNNNNTFTATTAQAYYWEVCSGNATIVGSNTSRTVTVSGTKTSKIKVTRFLNGNCYESCEIFTISPNNDYDCTARLRSIWCSNYTGTGNYNIYINARVDGRNPFNSRAKVTVKWNPQYINGLQAAGGLSYMEARESKILPSQFAVNVNTNSSTGFYIPMIVEYTELSTGTKCRVDLNPFVSNNCDLGPMRISNNKDIKLHPNPNNSGYEVSFNGVDLKSIKSIEVFNNRGENVTKINKPNSKSINSKKLDKGLYFIKFNLKDETITKKLIIE